MAPGPASTTQTCFYHCHSLNWVIVLVFTSLVLIQQCLQNQASAIHEPELPDIPKLVLEKAELEISSPASRIIEKAVIVPENTYSALIGVKF